MKDKTKEELKQLIQDQFQFHFNGFTDAFFGALKNSNVDVTELKESLEKEKQYSKNLEEMILSLNNELNKYKAICKERAYNEEP